jgi:hypothetical protein
MTWDESGCFRSDHYAGDPLSWATRGIAMLNGDTGKEQKGKTEGEMKGR